MSIGAAAVMGGVVASENERRQKTGQQVGGMVVIVLARREFLEFIRQAGPKPQVFHRQGGSSWLRGAIPQRYVAFLGNVCAVLEEDGLASFPIPFPIDMVEVREIFVPWLDRLP